MRYQILKPRPHAILFLLLTLVTTARPPSSFAEDNNLPKIGLALAGGGALGFAHIGVLKVLEEQRVPVHIVTGTSMGAIVGAAYASGRSIAELEEILKETDWDKLFDESSKRRDVPYRFKAGREREIYGDVKLSFNDNGLVLPAGIIQGQYIVPVLQKLYETVPSPVVFDDLPLPFRAVTADIETGEPFIPEKGDLPTVVRASMSVPAVFAPVEIQNKLVVDGGIANNLPIDQAFKLGAEQIIAVELYADLKKVEALRESPLAITGQIVSILLAQNSAIQRQLLRKSDILIAPNLKGYSSTDFNKSRELIALGEEAARKAIPELRKYSVSEKAYEAYHKRRYRSSPEKEVIEFIEVESASGLQAKNLIKDFDIKVGDTFNREKMEHAMQGMYSSGQYRQVNYNFVEKDGKKGVILSTADKEWFDKFVRVGAAIEDDFDGSSNYRLGVNYRINSIGPAKASMDIDAEIGRSPNLFWEYYRPFSEGSRFFLAPSLRVGRYELEVRNNDDVIAQYLRTSGSAGLRAGRQLGKSGEFSLGVMRGFGELERDIGSPELPEISYDTGDAIAAFVIDDLDAPDFPTEGSLISLTSRSSLDALGSSDEFNDVVGTIGAPFTFGRNTLLLRGNFAQTFDRRPAERSFSLGGFFNISGYEQQSLLASDFTIGQAIFFRRFSELKVPFFGFGFFAGGSLELAKIQSDIERVPDSPLITAGSAFIGADTPLLPVYIGFGLNDQDESSVYFAIGRLSAYRYQ